jgi:hypothetical protein
VADCVKSPLSVSTGSAAVAWFTPGAAGFDPPTAASGATSPPVPGASAAVAADTGCPSSTYGCPETPSEAVKLAVTSDPPSKATGVSIAGQELNASCTGHPVDVHDDVPSEPLVTAPNVPAELASHLFTVPVSLHDRPPLTASPPAVPMPSTPLRNGTGVLAAAVLYSQFSDTYRPVPVPAEDEYPAAA